jgi:hypothetical protein
VVHGAERGAPDYRTAYRAYAEAERAVVLAPIFPVGVLGDGNPDGYKVLKEGDLRYDLLLLAMVQELSLILDTPFPTFQLAGFSGGAQFVHRFMYLHPDRLSAVSIGAPGAVTRIDAAHDYWFGPRNLDAVFGAGLALDRLRRLRIQVIVGQDDLEILETPAHLQALFSQLGDLGSNRGERSFLLLDNYRRHGLDVTHTLAPGLAHEGLGLVPHVAAFLSGRSGSP